MVLFVEAAVGFRRKPCCYFRLSENPADGGLQIDCLKTGNTGKANLRFATLAEPPRQYVKSLFGEQYSLICRLLENKYCAFSVDIGIRAGLRQ